MATLATNVSFQCLGLDGKPLAGGKVYTYEAGTTTPKSTYTTMAGDVPNLNPVILDQNGKAKIFLGDGAYRMRILDSNDALIDDIDQISRYVTQSEFATFQQTVQDGVNQLAQIRDQVDVFVETAITTQKGYANGITPLDPNVKIDPIYLPAIPAQSLPSATTTDVGVTQLNDTLTSTSTTEALTAAQGKALNDKMFGVGQTWQDVTASRSLNTTYINTDPKARYVAVSCSGTNASIFATVAGVDLPHQNIGNSLTTTVGAYFVVPPGATYKVAGGTLSKWAELKL